eukprot:Nk52_evm45s240 gene=Nk52_evmTU45s240
MVIPIVLSLVMYGVFEGWTSGDGNSLGFQQSPSKYFQSSNVNRLSQFLTEDRNVFAYVEVSGTEGLIASLTSLLSGATISKFSTKQEMMAFCTQTASCWAGLDAIPNNVNGFNYTIMMNYDLFYGFKESEPKINVNEGWGTFGNTGYLALQNEIDWYTFNTAQTTPYTVSISTLQFTSDTNETKNQSKMKSFFDSFMQYAGASVMILILTNVVFSTVVGMVFEKETKIKEAMMMMGLSNSVYYLSWFVTQAVLFTGPWILSAVVVNLGIYKESDFVIVGAIFWLTGMSLITLSFCLISFFDKVNMAGLIAAFVVCGFAGLAQILYTAVSPLPAAVVYVLSVFSPCAFIFAIIFLGEAELNSTGVSMSNIYSLKMSHDVEVYMGGLLTFMLFDIFFYIGVAWYMNQVIPSEFGTSRPWYFLFTKSFWRGNECDDQKADEEIEDDSDFTPPVALEEVKGNVPVGIDVQNVSKIFTLPNGSYFKAVNRLTMKAYKGQVLSFLGHNGAGKSTCIGMLTGLTPITSGDAFINGVSVKKDMAKIRQSLGVCPQHDILWGKLTVKQTITIFAGLKGIPEDKIETSVNTIIEDIGLTYKADTFTESLSGGQKRKVCIAMAFLGGSQTVFLDEPTGGMDPYSRREVWDMVLKYKSNRTIVLTTHFMDEADILGDRVAIISQGHVKCAGTSSFLKSELGSGYSIIFAKNVGNHSKPLADSNTLASLHKVVSGVIPEAVFSVDVGSEVIYKLPREKSKLFPQLFRKLDESMVSFGISGYGLSVTSLEEVFLRLADEEHAVTEEDKKPTIRKANTLSKIEHFPVSSAPERKHMISKQKTFYAQNKNRSSTLLSLNIPKEVGGSPKPAPGERSTDIEMGSLDPVVGSTHNLVGEAKKNERRQSVPEKVLSESEKFGQQIAGLFLKHVWVAKQNAIMTVFNIIIPVACFLIGCLASMSYESNCDFLDTASPRLLTYDSIFSSSEEFPNAPTDYTDFTGMNVNNISFSGYDPLVSYVQSNQATAEGGLNSTVQSQNIDYVGIINVDYKSYSPACVINAANNAIANKFSTSSIKGYFSYPFFQLFTVGVDVSQESNSNFEKGLFFMIFLLIAISYYPGASATIIIKERADRVKHQLMVSGTNGVAYWTAYLCFDLIITNIFSVIAFAIFWGFFDGKTETSAFPTFLLILVLYTPATLLLGYCLSFMFHTYSKGHGAIYAMLMGSGVIYMVAFAGVAIRSSVNDALINMSWPMMFISPVVPVLRATISLLNVLSASCPYVNSNLDFFEIDLCGSAIIVLCAQIVIYAIILYYLEFKEAILAAKARQNMGVTPEDVESELRFPKDSDVKAEEERIKQTADNNDLIILKNIRKEYPPGPNGKVKVACYNMSFGVPRGECFGLLGTNGAGKTSTLRTISGDLLPTSGDALINGYSVTKELKSVEKSLGIVPQFDACIDILTVRQHLWMYCRIKNIVEKDIEVTVNSLLARLDLEKHADKQTRQLSGGNRRKCSLAIALIGNPAVILLDEPSTGMDPEAKRYMWDVILDLKKEHAVIITTHSMEEADALCSRIGIMVDGRLQCLGSPQHLKLKYGDGYHLEVRSKELEPSMRTSLLDVENVVSLQRELGEFIKSSFLRPKLVEERAGHLHYEVLLAGEAEREEYGDSAEGKFRQFADVFEAFESLKSKYGIEDYSISQTSLEQIFLQFGARQIALTGQE